jgi:MFS family permease
MAGGGRSIPFLSDLRPWQVALMLVGLPGLLVALLSLTVREPARRERDTSGVLSFGRVLGYLSANGVLYGTLMLGAALAALANFGAFSWVPALFTRRFGWTPKQIGLTFGPATLVCGTAGLLAAGALASKFAASGRPAPYTKIMAISMALGAIPAATLVAVNDPYWTLGCLGLMVFFMSTPIGLAQTALQAITPNEMRAQVIAIYLLTTALVGNACGPSAVAAMTDYYFRNDAAVGSSIAVVATLAAVASAVIIWSGASAYALHARLNKGT